MRGGGVGDSRVSGHGPNGLEEWTADTVTERLAASKGGEKAALSRDLSEFLIELSIAVHRHAMYPGDHPSLVPAAENVIEGLSTLFSDRKSLAIGVAQRQLVIEGVATDPRHPVLSDLAHRLHSHQIGAISFQRGASLREVRELLRTLAQDPERGGEPIGLMAEGERPGWTHIRLHPVDYDRLNMKEADFGEGGSKAGKLWLNMAQAALADEEEVSEGNLDARALARRLGRRAKDGAYEEVIVDYLRQLAEELRDAEGEEAEEIRRRLAALVEELDPDALARLVRMGGSFTQRKKFLMDAAQGLPVDAVVKILRAGAEASGQNISTSLTRMLSKLAAHSETGPRHLRAQATNALLENVEELISDWELEDPNPDQYTRVLDQMARAAPVLSGTEEGDEGLEGAERIVQMALEVDAEGPTLHKAVADLVDAGGVSRVLALADRASEGSQVAERLRRQLATPHQLRRLLSGEDVDRESLRQLVDRLGDQAIAPLFEILIESEYRSVRRKVFDCIAELGPRMVEHALDRLDDSRWYVRRNILALLHRLEELPEGFDPTEHLGHSDPRVRREAFPLAFRDPGGRQRALAQALGDSDERIVRMALLELQDGIGDALVPVVVNRVLRNDALSALRSLAVRAIGTSRVPLALDALLEICDGGRSVLGRRRLAPKSPELVSALKALSERWADHPKAEPILQLARKSSDVQILAAVTSTQEVQ